MKKQLSSFIYFWKEGIRNIFMHGFMSFAAVSIIIICLLITGSVVLVSHNIDLQIVALQQESEIVMYLDDSVSETEARALSTTLSEVENVASVTFLPQTQALEEYREKLGDNAILLDGFNESNNPLRDGYSVTMVDVSQVETTRDALAAIDGVDYIRVNEEVIMKLIQVQNVFNMISWVLTLALGLISVFIISNTVKLAMVARRPEISIQKMVGATNTFIRWPFIIEGLLLGAFAGGVAFGLEWLIYTELAALISGVLSSFAMVDFMSLYQMVAVAFVGIGAIVGVGGSALTIRRFMDV